MRSKNNIKKTSARRLAIKKNKNVVPICVSTTIPTLQVSEVIGEKEREMLRRVGIKTVTIEDMVKRREKNLSEFRKMKKPGFYGFEVKAEMK